ncbi:MAG: hypothetical protein IPJ06_02160 [Saprospiraceae bacterium]|nr:hypothetical protein [Saprospiraceae bacterium]
MSQPSSTPQLLRVLGLSTGILLVASSMIGSGIFKKIAPMAETMQDGGDILLAPGCWLASFPCSGLLPLPDWPP